MKRRIFLQSAAALLVIRPSFAEVGAFAQALIEAARSQIGVTTGYNGAYVALDYPMGDVPRQTGVCTDVLIRAFRDAHGIDLQVLVHEDMRANFAAYPKNWGLSGTDRNIDHRRVPNLERYFERKHLSLPIGEAADYQPGDIVSWRLAGNLPHIGIVSDQKTRQGVPLIIHNIGGGAEEDDILFRYEMIGHYRWKTS